MTGAESERTTGEPRVAALTVFAAAVPCATLVVLAAVVLVEVAGGHPFTEAPPVTLAEAAYRGDLTAAARFIGLGADPATPSAVLVSDLDTEPVMMTPIEAAARGGSDDMIGFLDPLVTVSPDVRRDLVCLARADDRITVADRLARPLGGSVSCDSWADPRTQTR